MILVTYFAPLQRVQRGIYNGICFFHELIEGPNRVCLPVVIQCTLPYFSFSFFRRCTPMPVCSSISTNIERSEAICQSLGVLLRHLVTTQALVRNMFLFQLPAFVNTFPVSYLLELSRMQSPAPSFSRFSILAIYVLPLYFGSTYTQCC